MDCDKAKCHIEDDLTSNKRDELKLLRGNMAIYQQHTTDNQYQCQVTISITDVTNLQQGKTLFVVDFKSNH